MVESRGGTEDRLLKDIYKEVYNKGTNYRPADWFQNALTSKEIKVKNKKDNIAGLQIADLLAYDSKQQILIEQEIIEDKRSKFAKDICEVLEIKYNRHLWNNQVWGYGKKLLR